MNDNLARMKELNKKLKTASDSYYKDHKEIMSNFEYDALFDELQELEELTGIILEDSVTNNIGNDLTADFKKAIHSKPVLSLSKTKSIDELIEFADNKTVNISMKLDGLTIILIYTNGTLTQAVTRGNGLIGDEITAQAKLFKNVPKTIKATGITIIRGEALISYSDFNKINTNNQYKNPRNLASGTVKNKDLTIFKERPVNFIAFELVHSDKDTETHTENLNYLKELGFTVVDNKQVTATKISETITDFTNKVQNNYDWPVDGLVIFIDSLKEQEKLGVATHHPKYGKAFKWQDTCAETILRDIDWNRSRSGRLNPIAIFDPVELEGSTVTKASLHNVTYIEDMQLNIGDKITVYKANMIIPQIAENLTKSLKDVNTLLPKQCPKCGSKVTIKNDGIAKFVYCTNANCVANLTESIQLFTSVLEIKHMAKQIINKLISANILTSRLDLFKLKDKREEFINIDGLGEKMFNKLTSEISTLNPYPHEFIAALGIPLVSLETAKIITKGRTLNELLIINKKELNKLEGIGDIISKSITDYFKTHTDEIKKLANNINFKEEKMTTNNNFITGKKFAVTGSLNTYKNRNELKAFIESKGGKVTGVSKTTDYLINNNPASTSAKNKKAKELGIQIITEEEFNNSI